MKVDELLEDQLDEVALRKLAAIGATALALTGAGDKAVHKPNQQPAVQTITKPIQQDEIRALTDAVMAKYSTIDRAKATRIVKLAKKHEDATFPKAKDILAIIGVESSFDHKAVSRLKHDPAIGLMQVRPGIWDLDGSKLASSVDEQVKVGAGILKHYYDKLHSKEAAVGAYNVGLKNYLHGKQNPSYVAKYRAELKQYAQLSI
jgi:hypothetical protein